MGVRKPLKILLDTNVWLDRLIPGRKGFDTARELIDGSVGQDIELLYAMHSLNDVFYQVGLETKHWVKASTGRMSDEWAHVINARCWECIDDMSEIATAVGADGSDVWIARHLREVHNDFEDDMILAAARRAEADYLVTSDQRLIQKATVAALLPDDMLTVLRLRAQEGAAYGH